MSSLAPVASKESEGAAKAAAAPAPTSSRSVDLERREDRFIIFVRDTPELVEELRKFTRQLEFPQTPVTRTVYFGDTARGLPPGLSIKARTYERERLPGRWDLDETSNFQLLELKRTVDVERLETQRRGKSFKKKARPRRDQMVEILRLSGSILSRTTYKSKHRKAKITLDLLLQIIDNPTKLQRKIDHQLYVYLLETVHPLADYRWRPLIGTEYERSHFVTKDETLGDTFRATLDKRVTHYSFTGDDRTFVGVPVGTEDFSRFEVKTDHERIAGTELGEWLDDVIVKFRAFRIPSKKYRGLTLRSQYNIEREGLRDEVPGARVYTVFPSKPVRYRDQEHYVNLARYIKSSRTFRLFKSEARLVESHEHFVRGRHKGLDVLIKGSALIHERDPEIEDVKGVTIYSADRTPVSRVPLTSCEDLNVAAITKMKKRETRYERTRGFLVENRKSGRVYKVSIERHILVRSPQEFKVSIEYAGRSRSSPNFNAQDAIVKDICMLTRFLRKDPLLKGG